MPLCVLAERRLWATRSSSERAAAPVGRAWQIRRRIEPVERFGRDAARLGDGENLPRQFYIEEAIGRHRQRVGDRLVGERRGEEHRAVGLLAPQVAPDVRRDDRAVVEIAPGIANGRGARRDSAVDLTDDHRAAAAVVNHPRLHVVSAEVDERADRALGAHDMSAIVSSLSPFCAEITQPAALRCGRSARAAASV